MKKLYFLTLFLFSCRVYVVSKRNTAKLSEMNETKAEQQGKRNIEMTRFWERVHKTELVIHFLKDYLDRCFLCMSNLFHKMADTLYWNRHTLVVKPCELDSLTPPPRN